MSTTPEGSKKIEEDDPNFPAILKIKNPNKPPIINKVKNRLLFLSPTVNAGLERECIISDFEKDPRAIGKGAFGKVWKVVHKATGKVWCIKVLSKQIDSKTVEKVKREIEIMYLLNHPHCLRLKNHFEDDNNFYLIMPLAAKGQLYQILKKIKKFDEKTAAQILRETISALQYMHSFKPPIIHRDLKPENLLINDQGRIYLADYGESNFKNEDEIRKTFCGTTEYVAPEMLKQEGYDHRIDVWAVGVLMFELLAGYSPFYAKESQMVYQNIRRLKINWPLDMPPLAKNLISKILKLNPNERLTFPEILKHKWFTSTRMLKPLLENDLTTTKDLLMFHMMNKVSPEIELKINNILNLNEKDIIGTSKIDKDPTVIHAKKENIVNKIRDLNNLNAAPTLTCNVSSNSIGINVAQDKMDQFKMENAKLNKEINSLKVKLNLMENENLNLKSENSKLKEVNTTTLQEEIKKLNEEIEKLKIKDKDRLAMLTEVEEKNTKISELNTKVQMTISEKEQMSKENDNLKNQIKELNKQLEIKDITIDQLNKKNDSILSEKDQLFYDYQKKIELLQLKVLQENNNSPQNEKSLSQVIDLLNESIKEIKNIFQKKFDVFIENFNLFKKEYNLRDEKFNSLLNEKSTGILEQIQKFNSNLIDDLNKTFAKLNTPNKDTKDLKIEWLNNQISELSKYKIKGIENERKIEDLTNKLDVTNKKYELAVNEKNILKKEYELKEDEVKRKTYGGLSTPKISAFK